MTRKDLVRIGCNSCGTHVYVQNEGSQPGWMEVMVFIDDQQAATGDLDFCSWACLTKYAKSKVQKHEPD